MTGEGHAEAAGFLADAFLAELDGLISDSGRPFLVKALCALHVRGLWHQGPQDGPSEADQLWEALDVVDGQRVVEAVLIGKIVDFGSDDQKPPTMSIATTDGMDWVQQYGMLHGALALQNGLPWQNTNDSTE